MIKSSQFLNLEEMERLLAHHYRESLDTRAVSIDLAEVLWTSPLSINLVDSWIFELVQRGSSVRLILPQNLSYASRLFHTMRFGARLADAGCEVSATPKHINALPPVSLALFERFPTLDDAHHYFDRLQDGHIRRHLLHAQRSEPDILAAGHFHSVLLRELTDNCFAHAEGRNCHISTFQTTSDNAPSRRDHQIYAPFAGGNYLEICVSDNGRRDLINTLGPHVPKSFTRVESCTPPFKKLSKAAKAILYSFEYDSTSNPKRRADQVAALLGGEATNSALLATGLFEIASLARAYQGQVVVRVANCLLTIDFTRELAGEARLYSKSKLADVPGTTILVRVPAHRDNPTLFSVRQTHGAMHSSRSTETRASGYLAEAGSPHVSLPVLDRHVRNTLSRPATEGCVLVLFLDAVDLDSKAFGVLLQLLSRVPRNGRGLVLVVDDERLLEAAQNQWDAVTRSTLGTGGLVASGLVVTNHDATAVTTYGQPNAADATHGDDGMVFYPPSLARATPLRSLLKLARIDALNTPTEAIPVCHTGGYFLIEGEYYTSRFYEVCTLLELPGARSLAMQWLACEIQEHAPTSIIYTIDFLAPFAKDAIAIASLPAKPDLLPLKSETIVSTVASLTQGPLLVIVDVLCTGRTVRRLLDLHPNPKLVRIAVLVDAREKPLSFLALETQHGTIDIQVSSAHSHAVPPIRSKPPDLQHGAIRLIDKARHTVLPRVPLNSSPVPPSLLFALASDSGALSVGHFTLSEQHHAYFLAFAPLFRSLSTQIEQWLKDELGDLLNTPGIAESKLETYCLDEGTGLLQLADAALRARGHRPAQLLTREELDSPRLTRSKSAIWFILPASASGATVHRCLAAANRAEAARVRISVVSARVDTPAVTFYEKVTGYASIPVEIRHFLVLPIPVYSASTCPTCERVALWHAMGPDLSKRFPLLGQAAREARDREAHVPLSSPAGSGGAPASYADEALAYALYITARSDIEARKDLRAKMEESSSFCLAMARAIGRGFGDEAFSPQTATSILYRDPRGSDQWSDVALREACLGWLQDSRLPSDFACEVRGVSIMAPSVLEEMLPQLLAGENLSTDLFRALLGEVLLQERLWPMLSGASSYIRQELVEPLRQMKDLISRGGTTANGVIALSDVQWFLQRSTDWGMSLSNLKHEATAADHALPTWSAFANGAVPELRRLAESASLYGLWRRIDLPSVWESYELALQDLHVSVAQFKQHGSGSLELYNAIMAVDNTSRKLLYAIDKVGAQSHSTLQRLEQVGAKLCSYTTNIAEDCPSLAVDENTLVNLLYVLLENSSDNRAAGLSPPHLELTRHGDLHVKVQLLDSRPWRRETGPHGGLALLREKCQEFGASYAVPREGEPSNIEVVFRAWPIAGENRGKNIDH